MAFSFFAGLRETFGVLASFFTGRHTTKTLIGAIGYRIELGCNVSIFQRLRRLSLKLVKYVVIWIIMGGRDEEGTQSKGHAPPQPCH